VTVIDGESNSTTVVPAGQYPSALAVNPETNQIYVVNAGDGTVTAIDGATNSTQTIAVGSSPGLVAVDPDIDKIYVTNDLANGSLTTIDGATGSTTTIGIVGNPYAVTADPADHRVYAANLTGNSVSVIGTQPGPPRRPRDCNSFLPRPAGWWTHGKPTGNLAVRRSVAALSATLLSLTILAAASPRPPPPTR
jgi:YVTN family beta-propeller protein